MEAILDLFNKSKFIKKILLSLIFVSILGCGAGEDSNLGGKYYLKSDLTFMTDHSSVQEKIKLSGLIPSLSLGKTTVFLSKQINNGWADHFFQLEIMDSNGLNGQYECIPASSTHSSPDLSEGDCFIRFNNDDYIGYSESWAVGDASCIVQVVTSELGVANIYNDLVLNINCEDMVNAFTLQNTVAIPEGADLDSKLSISGEIYASNKSGRPSTNPSLQDTTVSLSTTGGDGIIDSDLQLEALVGISHTLGVFSGIFKDQSDEYELHVYLNAPYEITGEFECNDPPSVIGYSPALFLNDRECLVTIKKPNSEYYHGWVWDSRAGGECKINVTNARLESTLYPVYDFQADINCPNMVTQAITYDYTYPSGVVPGNLNLTGSFNFNDKI